MANDPNRLPLENAIVEDVNLDKDKGDKIDWHQSHKYAKGRYPSVAITNDGLVVAVHNSALHNTLRYRVGKVKGNKIDWHQSHKYDEGLYPSVAIANDGLVVAVHRSENVESILWYRVGKVKGDKIDWNQSHKYDKGDTPLVAITNDGLVVAVHRPTSEETLKYQVGKINGGKINWNQSHKYDKRILISSVAIAKNGLVFVVHKPKDRTAKPFYQVGKVEGDKIDWRQSHEYTVQGTRFAITNDGLVVAVHIPGGPTDKPFYQLGRVKGDKIDWHQRHKYNAGGYTSVATADRLVVEVHASVTGSTLWYRVGDLKGDKGKSPWNQVRGKNSYCRCACRSAGNNKEKHHSQHKMNITKGAPYFYAVLTKDNDSINFPKGAKLTIEGPDGTKYDRDIEEKNKLVIMSGDSVRYLIIKDPKPGKWKMTMTAPKGVGFHCECNTVPSKDVYDTMKQTLDRSLQRRDSGGHKFLGLWTGLAILGAFLFPEVEIGVLAFRALWMAASLDLISYALPKKSGGTHDVDLSRDEQIQAGKAVGKTISQKQEKGGVKKAAKLAMGIAFSRTKKKKKEGKPYALLTWNFQGANWNDSGFSPWDKVAEWFGKGNSANFPYRLHVACLQECGALPSRATGPHWERELEDGVKLEEHFWSVGTDRFPLFLYILFYKWDKGGNRVNLAVVSPAGIHNHSSLPGHLRPLVGIKQARTYFYTLHGSGSSGGGGDSWALLRDVKERHPQTPWWVAGDYNQEPRELRQKLANHEINLTVCPPNQNTHPSINPRRKLDYAARNQGTRENLGDVFLRDGLAYSDHLPVFYKLGSF
ncbi:MAG: hypothetical protein ACRCZS_25715 [Chroococcidiopsis sp.]